MLNPATGEAIAEAPASTATDVDRAVAAARGAFEGWAAAYSSERLPAWNDGVPVVHLGEAHVAGQCSYRVTFRVPDVPSGTYGIVSIEHSGGGSAALGKPIEFRVTP